MSAAVFGTKVSLAIAIVVGGMVGHLDSIAGVLS